MKKFVSLFTAVLFLFTVLPVGILAADEGLTVKDSMGTTLEAGATIDTVEGVLTLEVADASAIELSNITISYYTGAVVATATSETEIEIKFGRLSAGEHTLTVGEDTFTFNAAKYYHTNTDFSDYTIGENTGNAANLCYLCGWTNTDATNSGYTLTAKTSGDKYLKFTTQETATCTCNTVGNTHGLALSAGALGNFNSTSVVNEDKVFVIDAVIKGGSGSKTFVIDAYDEDGTSKINPATGLVAWNAGKAENTNLVLKNNEEGATASYAFATKDSTVKSLREPKAVLRRADDGTLARDLYDVLNNHAYVGTSTTDVDGAYTVPRIGVMTKAGPTSTAYDLFYDSVQAYPERLLSVLKVEAADDGSNTVILHMSDDVLESVSGSVKVTNSAETEISGFTQTVDNDNRTVTLGFAGGLAADTYTVDISALYGSNQLKAYTGTETFTLESAWQEDALAAPVVTDYFGATLEGGGTIRTIDGELILTFENDVDPDTVDGITISGAVGKVVKEATENVVTLKFGRLDENVNYTLNVPATVKATDGRSFPATDLAFTAEKEYLTNVDFDTYTTEDSLETKLAGDKLSAIYSAYDNYDGYKYGLIKTYSSAHDQANKNYLSLHPEHGADTSFGKNKTLGLVVRGDLKDADGNYYLPDGNFNSTKNVDAEKVYVMDAGAVVSTSVGSAFGSMGTGSDNPSTSSILLTKWKPYTDKGTWSATPMTSEIDLVSGIRLPRMVLTRSGEGLSQQLYYGGASGGYTYVGTKTGVVTDSTSTIDRLTVLAGNSAYSYYTDDSTGNATGSNSGYNQQYRWIKCYPDMLASVLEEEHEGNKAIFYMSDDIDADSTSNIVVTVGEEELDASAFDAEFDADDRSLTITLPADSREYTIDMTALMSEAGLRMYAQDAVKTHTTTDFCVGSVEFKNGETVLNDNAEALGEATAVSVQASVVNPPAGIVAFIAVYGEDENGNSVLLSAGQADISDDGTISATSGTFAAGATQARLFVWEGVSNLRPLADTLDCL